MVFALFSRQCIFILLLLHFLTVFSGKTIYHVHFALGAFRALAVISPDKISSSVISLFAFLNDTIYLSIFGFWLHVTLNKRVVSQ